MLKILTSEEKEVFKKAFPLLDVDKEIVEMTAWLIANPKRQLKRPKQFALNWLRKAHQKARPHFQEALDRLEANFSRQGRDYRKVLLEWERNFSKVEPKDFLEAIHWVIMTPERKFWPSVMAIKAHLPSKPSVSDDKLPTEPPRGVAKTLEDLSKDLAGKMTRG